MAGKAPQRWSLVVGYRLFPSCSGERLHVCAAECNDAAPSMKKGVAQSRDALLLQPL